MIYYTYIEQRQMHNLRNKTVSKINYPHACTYVNIYSWVKWFAKVGFIIKDIGNIFLFVGFILNLTNLRL